MGEQILELHHDTLTTAGCERTLEDIAGGSKKQFADLKKRPVAQKFYHERA
jgi:hypothetical protein